MIRFIVEKMKENPVEKIEDTKEPSLEPQQNNEVKVGLVRIPFYSTLAFKVVLGYVVLWAIVVFLLSNTFFHLIGMSDLSIAHFQPYKRWIFLFITALLLYFVVSLQATKLQLKNQLLDAAEKKVNRLNRMHRLLSAVNHVILRSRDRKQLLRDICNIIQERGHFSFVWIGLGETEAILPQVIVTSGSGSHYLQDLFDGLQIASAEERGEPALSSFRKKHDVVVNDIQSFSKKQFAWQKRAIENAYQAVAAFPLKTSSGLSGVFAIYAAESQVFTEDEINILREMAADISYGLSDIEQKEQLYYAANYDVITNLPNRQLLDDRVNQAIARAYHDKRFVGMAVIELIELENMITAFGQAAGDKILQETSRHFSRLLRDGDTIARLGNHQMAIMLSDVADVYDVPMVIQKVMRPFLVHLTNHKEVPVKMRAGVSIYPKDAENATMLIKNAEAALKGMAPDQKMDCAFFSKDIGTGARYNQSIEEELEGALDRNEFTLYYQPIVDINSRMIMGVEAFTRWKNQKLGEVSPIQFIGVAEEKGWIGALGEWTLKSACTQLKEWKQSGFQVPLSLNISSKQLISPQFADRLKAVFSSCQFDPKEYSLTIEISEDALIDEPKQVIDLFTKLKDMGLKIYVDDFGTGYASLSYLHKLPVDGVKIDSLLIRGIEKDQSARTMIKGILAFAEGLGVKSIAEGVETDKQLKILGQLGCQLAQGYYFSPPLLSKSMSTLFDKPI